MRAFALTKTADKSATHHFAHNRGKKETHEVIFPAVFSGFPIQHKASCTCGGGCTTCQERSGALRISHPNDPSEIEADQIASSMGRSTGRGKVQSHIKKAPDTIHAKVGETGGESAISPEIANRINLSRGGGASLNASARGHFEQGLGADFSHVRIHTNAQAEEINRALSAKAFSFGRDVFFGAGQFQPDTDSGKILIAHELAHVMQGGDVVRRCKELGGRGAL